MFGNAHFFNNSLREFKSSSKLTWPRLRELLTLAFDPDLAATAAAEDSFRMRWNLKRVDTLVAVSGRGVMLFLQTLLVILLLFVSFPHTLHPEVLSDQLELPESIPGSHNAEAPDQTLSPYLNTAFHFIWRKSLITGKYFLLIVNILRLM